jgi:hypothetical protein
MNEFITSYKLQLNTTLQALILINENKIININEDNYEIYKKKYIDHKIEKDTIINNKDDKIDSIKCNLEGYNLYDYINILQLPISEITIKNLIDLKSSEDNNSTSNQTKFDKNNSSTNNIQFANNWFIDEDERGDLIFYKYEKLKVRWILDFKLYNSKLFVNLDIKNSEGDYDIYNKKFYKTYPLEIEVDIRNSVYDNKNNILKLVLINYKNKYSYKNDTYIPQSDLYFKLAFDFTKNVPFIDENILFKDNSKNKYFGYLLWYESDKFGVTKTINQTIHPLNNRSTEFLSYKIINKNMDISIGNKSSFLPQNLLDKNIYNNNLFNINCEYMYIHTDLRYQNIILKNVLQMNFTIKGKIPGLFLKLIHDNNILYSTTIFNNKFSGMKLLNNNENIVIKKSNKITCLSDNYLDWNYTCSKEEITTLTDEYGNYISMTGAKFFNDNIYLGDVIDYNCIFIERDQDKISIKDICFNIFENKFINLTKYNSYETNFIKQNSIKISGNNPFSNSSIFILKHYNIQNKIESDNYITYHNIKSYDEILETYNLSKKLLYIWNNHLYSEIVENSINIFFHPNNNYSNSLISLNWNIINVFKVLGNFNFQPKIIDTYNNLQKRNFFKYDLALNNNFIHSNYNIISNNYKNKLYIYPGSDFSITISQELKKYNIFSEYDGRRNGSYWDFEYPIKNISLDKYTITDIKYEILDLKFSCNLFTKPNNTIGILINESYHITDFLNLNRILYVKSDKYSNDINNYYIITEINNYNDIDQYISISVGNLSNELLNILNINNLTYTHLQLLNPNINFDYLDQSNEQILNLKIKFDIELKLYLVDFKFANDIWDIDISKQINFSSIMDNNLYHFYNVDIKKKFTLIWNIEFYKLEYNYIYNEENNYFGEYNLPFTIYKIETDKLDIIKKESLVSDNLMINFNTHYSKSLNNKELFEMEINEQFEIKKKYNSNTLLLELIALKLPININNNTKLEFIRQLYLSKNIHKIQNYINSFNNNIHNELCEIFNENVINYVKTDKKVKKICMILSSDGNIKMPLNMLNNQEFDKLRLVVKENLFSPKLKLITEPFPYNNINIKKFYTNILPICYDFNNLNNHIDINFNNPILYQTGDYKEFESAINPKNYGIYYNLRSNLSIKEKFIKIKCFMNKPTLDEYNLSKTYFEFNTFLVDDNNNFILYFNFSKNIYYSAYDGIVWYNEKLNKIYLDDNPIQNMYDPVNNNSRINIVNSNNDLYNDFFFITNINYISENEIIKPPYTIQNYKPYKNNKMSLMCRIKINKNIHKIFPQFYQNLFILIDNLVSLDNNFTLKKIIPYKINPDCELYLSKKYNSINKYSVIDSIQIIDINKSINIFNTGIYNYITTENTIFDDNHFNLIIKNLDIDIQETNQFKIRYLKPYEYYGKMDNIDIYPNIVNGLSNIQDNYPNSYDIVLKRLGKKTNGYPYYFYYNFKYPILDSNNKYLFLFIDFIISDYNSNRYIINNILEYLCTYSYKISNNFQILY